MENPPSVVIVGSFRKHLADIATVAQEMCDQGIRVLSPVSNEGVNPGAEFVILTGDCPTKSPRTLQRDVLVKIRTVTLVYLVNSGGYVGMSAAAEVAYSALVDARVLLHCAVTGFGAEVPEAFRAMVQKVPHSQQLATRAFADQVELARTNRWDIEAGQRKLIRAEVQTWMQSLSDQVPSQY